MSRLGSAAALLGVENELEPIVAGIAATKWAAAKWAAAKWGETAIAIFQTGAASG